MKKQFIIIGLFSILISCQNSTISPEKIYGKWDLKDVKTNQVVNNKEQYNKAIVQVVKSTKIEFFENNKMSGTIWGDTTFGYWSIRNDSLIILDNSNKKSFKTKILTLTDNKLILEETHGKVVQQLVFAK